MTQSLILYSVTERYAWVQQIQANILVIGQCVSVTFPWSVRAILSLFSTWRKLNVTIFLYYQNLICGSWLGCFT